MTLVSPVGKNLEILTASGEKNVDAKEKEVGDIEKKIQPELLDFSSQIEWANVLKKNSEALKNSKENIDWTDFSKVREVLDIQKTVDADLSRFQGTEYFSTSLLRGKIKNNVTGKEVTIPRLLVPILGDKIVSFFNDHIRKERLNPRLRFSQTEIQKEPYWTTDIQTPFSVHDNSLHMKLQGAEYSTWTNANDFESDAEKPLKLLSPFERKNFESSLNEWWSIKGSTENQMQKILKFALKDPNGETKNLLPSCARELALSLQGMRGVQLEYWNDWKRKQKPTSAIERKILEKSEGDAGTIIVLKKGDYPRTIVSIDFKKNTLHIQDFERNTEEKNIPFDHAQIKKALGAMPSLQG